MNDRSGNPITDRPNQIKILNCHQSPSTINTAFIVRHGREFYRTSRKQTIAKKKLSKLVIDRRLRESFM
jgi:hypothetical protein